MHGRNAMTTTAGRAEVASQGLHLLLAVADLTLTQLGIPGALACLGYLTGWWRVRTERDDADPERS
jgi:hypothetical protein